MNTAKSIYVEPEPSLSGQPISAAEWSALSKTLERRGMRRGLSREDAEDCAQETLIRLHREKPRPGVPPLEARAAAAHRQAFADEMRVRNRQKEVPADKRVPFETGTLEVPVDVDLDRRMRLMQLASDLADIVGHDAVAFLMEGQAGYTEADSEARRRPAAPSTGALRKRIARALPELAARLNESEGGR